MATWRPSGTPSAPAPRWRCAGWGPSWARGGVVVIVPAIIIPVIYLGRRLRTMSRRTQDALADMSAMATESLGATKTIKSFVQESLQGAEYPRRSEASFTAEIERLMARAVL